MATPAQPANRPANPKFSSGPCTKRPGWSLAALDGAVVGRSHRAKPAKAKLQQAIDLTRTVLEVPDDYRIAIVPGSDTGAMEMALWSMLGARGVDVLAWESFGLGWVSDITGQLKIADTRVFKADYGKLPDLAQVDFGRDVVFCWNGTTSGVRVPNGDWIAADRGGLTICDATSGAFAQNLALDKLDVVTFSWQKVLGGEGAHGMIVLSPRAVDRLTSYAPPWPVPKIFRLTKKGQLIEGLFAGETINTPSMLGVEDYIDALKWAVSIGGLPALMNRVDLNFGVLAAWVARTPWIDFFAEDPATRSNTSVTLKIVDPDVTALDPAAQEAFLKAISARLDKEKVAYDINYHRDAPPHFRIWAGATVAEEDLRELIQWLAWAYATEKAAMKAAA